MDEQREWLRLRKRKRMRLLAVVICFALLVTTYPNILESLSVLAVGMRGIEDENLHISRFVSLEDAVRVQTVPVGTAREELTLPDTLEAVIAVENIEEPSEGTGEGSDTPSDGTGEGLDTPSEGTGEEPDTPSEGTGEEPDKPSEGTGEGPDTPSEGTGEEPNKPSEGTGEEPNKPSEGTGEEPEEPSEDAGEEQESPETGEAEGTGEEGTGEADGTEESSDMETGDGQETHTVTMTEYYAENVVPVQTLEKTQEEGQEETVTISGVTWQSDPEYDGDMEGVYRFTAVLPGGYTLAEGVSLPEIEVTVQTDSIDLLIQALLERIAALPDAQEYMEEEPDIDDWEEEEDAYEEAYEKWMEGLYAYAKEAVSIQEAIEKIPQEKWEAFPKEALEKLAAWVEIAEQVAESGMMKMAAVGTHTCDGITFQPWTETDSLPQKGNYYLTENVELAANETFEISAGNTLNLCLDGKTIQGTASGKYALFLINGGTLNLYDCAGAGKVYHTGFNPVSLQGGGSFHLHGGTVEVEGNLAAVAVVEGNSGTGGTVNISGGEVKGGEDGAGIAVGQGLSNVSVTIQGGEVTGGNHGISILSGSLTVTGGTITGGTYYGVWASDGVATVSGGEISGGQAGVRIDRENVTITSGTITGGTYFGVWVQSDSEAAVRGGTITGGSAGVSVGSGNATISGGTITGESVGARVESGNLTISGGTITGGTSYALWMLKEGKISIAGNAMLNTAIYSSNTNGILASGTVSIVYRIKYSSDDNVANDQVIVQGSTDKDHYQLVSDTYGLAVSGGNLVAKGKYTVTYNKNSGTIANESDYTSYTYSEGLTLPTPTRTGYTFAGWYTDSSFSGNKVTSISTTDTGNKIYYAKWTANKYTITYSGMGGATLSTKPTQHTYGTATTIGNPTKAGYVFAGWKINGGSTAAKDLTLGATAYTANIALTATWTANAYTITYSGLEGAALSTKPTQHTYGTATKVGDPTKTGYAFAGWKVNSGTTATKNLTLGATDYTADITLTATWTANTYQVTFDYQGATGGNGTGQMTATYGARYGTLPTPARTGYTFEGWFTKANGQGSEIKAETVVNTAANHTLYAFWKDATKPDVPVCSIDLPTDWTNTQTTIPLTLCDNVGVTELWVSVDGKTYTAVSGFSGGTGTCNYNYTVTEGSHTYRFKAKDAEGNTSEESDAFTVKLDRGNPVFSKVPTTADVTSDGADITFTSSESGKAYWVVDPEEAPAGAQGVVEKGAQAGCVKAVTGSSPAVITITNLTPGKTHKVYVVLEDAAGNLSEVKGIEFATRSAVPVITLNDLEKDYEEEEIKIPENFGETEVYTDPDDPSGSIIRPGDDGFLPVEPGKPIYVRYPERQEGSVTVPAGDGVRIDIPERPAAPSPVQADVTGTTVTVKDPAADEEYILVPKGQEPDWSNPDHINETGEFTGLDENKEYDLYVRKKATEDAFASEPAKSEVRTYVTINEPEITGEGAGIDGNTAPRPMAPDAGGHTVTYTGTYGEEYIPVITIDGQTFTPGEGTQGFEIIWDEDSGEGDWKYVYTIPDGASEVDITVEFRKRVLTGFTVTPERLTIFADDAANRDAAETGDVTPLTAYLKEKSVALAVYDNQTKGEVQADTVTYITTDGFAPKGTFYRYTASTGGKSSGITLTVVPVNAAVTTPDGLLKPQRTGGYTREEVSAWLPDKVMVTYTQTGYAARTEERTVTWDAIGSGFGAQTGEETINGIVDLPAWATGQGDVGIGITFVDRLELEDAQMQLSMSGFSYGTGLHNPQGSVTATDTNPSYEYLYSADGGTTWVAADSLPKSGSGYLVPGTYRVKMTYRGDVYTGVKETSFTVTKKTLTAQKGTLEAVSRNFNGTTDAALKEGGEPALSGVVTGDDVTLGGTLEAHFAGEGPQENIPVNVTGFQLEGRDSHYYELGNTTITLYATINNADGTPPPTGGDSGGNSGDNGSDNDVENGGGDNPVGDGESQPGGTKPEDSRIPGDGAKPEDDTKPGDEAKSEDGTKPGDETKPEDGTKPGDETKPGNGTKPGDETKPGDGMKPSDETRPGDDTKSGDETKPDDDIESATGTKPKEGTKPGDSTKREKNNTAAGEDTLVVPVIIGNGRIIVSDQTSGGASESVTGDRADGASGASRASAGEPIFTGTADGLTTASTILQQYDGSGNPAGTVIVTVICEVQAYTAGIADTVAMANAVLTSEQLQFVQDAGTIEIRIKVTDISENVPPQDQKILENGMETYREKVPGLTFGMCIDISMLIRVGENGWDTITKSEEPVEIMMGIPETLLADGREYYVIRAHDGEHTLMSDMDDTPDTITISTDMFSSYAIVYRQTDGAGENGKSGLQYAFAKFLGICYFIWLAVVVAVILAVIFVVLRLEKKEELEKQDA